jgi:hypothetical protein
MKLKEYRTYRQVLDISSGERTFILEKTGRFAKLDVESLVKQAGLRIEHRERVNLFGSCSLIKCRKM